MPTSGSVLFKGKPAVRVKVTLHPKFDMPFASNGVTGQDCRFLLSTAAPADGAPPGEYLVTFELLRAGTDKRGLDTEFDAWKGKYANPDTAPEVTVGSSATALEPSASIEPAAATGPSFQREGGEAHGRGAYRIPGTGTALVAT